MYYYQQIENGETTAYLAAGEACRSDLLLAITEEQYNTAIANLHQQAQEESEAAEPSKDEKIAALEAENKALKALLNG